MVHGGVCDEANGFVVYPFPECDILVHDVRFDFGFQLEIEDLERSLSLEGDDFGRWVHDCAVCCDGPAHDSSVVVEVDNQHVVCLVHFLADAAIVNEIEEKAGSTR